MVDILPENTPLWQSMEDAALEVLSSYGYSEIRLPIIESTDCLLYTSPSPRDLSTSRMPSSA